jgi:hypothetical protein
VISAIVALHQAKDHAGLRPGVVGVRYDEGKRFFLKKEAKTFMAAAAD